MVILGHKLGQIFFFLAFQHFELPPRASMSLRELPLQSSLPTNLLRCCHYFGTREAATIVRNHNYLPIVRNPYCLKPQMGCRSCFLVAYVSKRHACLCEPPRASSATFIPHQSTMLLLLLLDEGGHCYCSKPQLLAYYSKPILFETTIGLQI